MFEQFLNSIGEYGTITQLQHPLLTIRGLPHAHPNEMLIFEEGQIGQVYDIDDNSIHALIYSQKPISLQSKVTRTNITMSVPISDNLLGKVIDPLTNILIGDNTQIKTHKTDLKDVFTAAPGISSRTPIKKQLITGVTKVDLLIPLGIGQRELIMGDVKTGKTMFLLRTIVNQAKYNNTVIIYAAIGKKKTEIITLHEYFKKEGISEKVITVATTAADIASTVYLTPYTAMTIAEHFRDQGQDVLLILDDMTTHSQRYREIALKSRRFPGRESYPGDIFYTHASLLERAGNFIHPQHGSVAITCLPVVLTTEGDVTGYISTNLMSMTDGHIFFDSDIFNKGDRPAINIPISVTRVGRQTQTALTREINRTILSTIAEYNKVSNIAYLGSELSEVSKNILKRGASLMNMLDQDLLIDVPFEVQILIFGYVWTNKLDLSVNKNYAKLLPSLLTIYENKQLLDQLHVLIDSPDLKTFVSGLSQNQQLMDLCKIENN